MKVFAAKENDNLFKRYLIPKNQDPESNDYIEITIDYTGGMFTARKIDMMSIDHDIWELYKENTFPSFLFGEFLRSSEIDR